MGFPETNEKLLDNTPPPEYSASTNILVGSYENALKSAWT